jgi:hypothetical protein
MQRKLAALPALCLIVAFCLSGAGAQESIDVHRAVMSLSKAQAPFIVDRSVVFSVDGPARYVGVAFSFENYARVHSFSVRKAVLGDEKSRDLFVLAWEIPDDLRDDELRYRYVIDGLWCRDPRNPVSDREGGLGVSVSVLRLPDFDPYTARTYKIVDEDGVAHFRFKAPSGERVGLAGDFSGWDPFLYELKETSPGVYELSLRLSPGLHRYAFIYRGERVFDPLNPKRLWDDHGRPANEIEVP